MSPLVRARRSARRREKDRTPPPPAIRGEINVTPLVDVVLVLLIIFMVVTPMLRRGVEVKLPATDHHDRSRQTSAPVIVSISAEGRVFLDTEPVGGAELGARVRSELERRPAGAGEVHVRADRNLSYGSVRKVLDQIHRAGAPRVALGTEDKREPR